MSRCAQPKGTHAGNALFQMIGVFAEFERAMIQDRVKAGLMRSRAQAKVFGSANGVNVHRAADTEGSPAGEGDIENCSGSGLWD